MIVSFAIFGHLIAGIWAGYLVLADRSQREFAPATTAAGVAVTVRCENRAEIESARAVLLAHRATSLTSTAIGAAQGS